MLRRVLSRAWKFVDFIRTCKQMFDHRRRKAPQLKRVAYVSSREKAGGGAEYVGTRRQNETQDRTCKSKEKSGRDERTDVRLMPANAREKERNGGEARRGSGSWHVG
ncbi:hypothetical protein PUN28_016369 [Cardiocondyla obscurior]|uniref:Uncharacterized protein n=1 Tax=Cardiocondyla obscurior TaxID=286306 RepID=A0AAW2EN02_9HYME